MKKFLSTILCLSMVFAMSVTAFAEGTTPRNLQSLANEYITVSSAENESIYSNIQDFYAAARAEFPSVSDIDLAKTVIHQLYPKGGFVSICKQSSKMHTFSPANAHFFTASF